MPQQSRGKKMKKKKTCSSRKVATLSNVLGAALRLGGRHVRVDSGCESRHILSVHANFRQQSPTKCSMKSFSFFLPFFKRSLGQKSCLCFFLGGSRMRSKMKRFSSEPKLFQSFGKIVIKRPAENNEKSHRQAFQLTMANKASATQVCILIR